MRAFCLTAGLLLKYVVVATEPQIVPLRFQHRAVSQHEVDILSKRQYFPASELECNIKILGAAS